MKKQIRLAEWRRTRPVAGRRVGDMRLARVLALAVLVLAAAFLTTAAAAATRSGAVVKLGQSSLGRILVDSHGRTLYLWAHDKHQKSTCYGACAVYWPALTTKKGKPKAIGGARKTLLGTTRRRDGRTQVTYRGHPLYQFAGDTAAGQTSGAGLTDFGGRWDPVSAAGLAARTLGMQSNSFKRPKLRHGVLSIVGTAASDKIALRLKAGNAEILQVDVGDNGSADFSFKRSQIARISVAALAGDDLVRIDEANGAFTDTIPTRINGGAGNDTLAGGSGAETLLGGDGNDVVDGNKGNDTALLGAGDDVFVWDPGDGSDIVEGGDGRSDTMRFNGAPGAEQFTLSANGSRFRLFRDVGNVTMDTAGVERVDINALGGADLVTVNDLSGTDVSSVNVDLAAALGGTTGDAAPDRVVMNGTAGDDAIDVSGDSGEVKVGGLAPRVAIFNQEATDHLELNGLQGNDTVNTAGMVAGTIQVFVDGALVP
jgi:predicted lipoprotein with Yx(FWY)xxD motif